MPRTGTYDAAQGGVLLPSRYRPIRHLASGGMAAVWAAQDLVLGREVAVKLLAEQFVGEVAAKARFEREARAAASMSSHPNVVTIYDVGEHADRPFIVMELFSGGTVRDAMRDGRIPRERALDWLAQAAAGLDAAHAHGVIHRDVKPANLLIEGPRLAVADFGIARLAWETSVTQTGEVLGTAAYLSPEQADGRPASAASDRYSLAVVAYELLTGRRPFAGDHFAAQARAHIEDEPPPASSSDPDLPAAVDPVLARGLAKGARERWTSGEAMVEALADSLEGPAVATASPTRTRVMAAPAGRGAGALAVAGSVDDDTPTPARTPIFTTMRERPRRPAGLMWLGLIPALALLLVAVLFVTGGDDGGGAGNTADGASAERPTTQTRSTEEPKRESSNADDAAGATAPAQTPPAPPPPAAPSGDSASLNAQGYTRMQSGDVAGAISLFQQAIKDCPVSTTDPCAYAYFNLGHALRLAGRPAEAIPILQARLGNPDQRGTVQQELAAAQAEAGQGAAPADGKPGKRKGNKKDRDDD